MAVFVGVPNVPIGIFAIISATLGAIVSLSSVQGWKRWGLAAIFILLGVGEFIVVERTGKSDTAERQRLQSAVEALPSQIAKQVKEYVTNTAPPITLPPYPVNKIKGMKPPPPTGLIVFTDQGTKAAELSHAIQDFLNEQGEPPKRLPNESDINFIVRSNNWYSQVMTKYKKDLGPMVNSFFQYLVGKKTLDPRAAELAKNPVNVRGIRALAAQLDAVAKGKT